MESNSAGTSGMARAFDDFADPLVCYCFYDLGETLIELDGFNLNVNRSHKG